MGSILPTPSLFRLLLSVGMLKRHSPSDKLKYHTYPFLLKINVQLFEIERSELL